MAKVLTTLPDEIYTIVYAAIVAQVKADATLGAVTPAIQWTTYTEDNPPVRNTPLDNNGLPAIRMMPFGLGATPEANVLQNSPLGIAVVMTTPGLDVRDLMNLWSAFSRSLMPGDGGKTVANSIRASIQAASIARGGINLGSVQTIALGRPAISPSTDQDRFMTAEGVILVQMTVPK